MKLKQLLPRKWDTSLESVWENCLSKIGLFFLPAACGLNKKSVVQLLTFCLVLFADGAVETVITFDQGAKWQTLRRPQNSHCDTETSTNRPKRVRHAHNIQTECLTFLLFVYF